MGIFHLHVLPGTPVIRLFPGSVQVGCDPGSEVIFSGLSPEQELWLMHLAARPLNTLAGYSSVPRACDVPDECVELAVRLVDAGFACVNSDQGLRVHCERVEGPVIDALECGIRRGIISSFTINDGRCSDFVSWPERFWAHGGAASQGVRDYLENVFPVLSRPVDGRRDIELVCVSLLEETGSASALVLDGVTRLMVFFGQNEVLLGPLLTAQSPICPLCCVHWVHDRRDGVAQRAGVELRPLARIHPRVYAQCVVELDTLLSDFSAAFHGGRLPSVLSSWQSRVRRIDSSGRCEDFHISPHPLCGCAGGRVQPFLPLR